MKRLISLDFTKLTCRCQYQSTVEKYINATINSYEIKQEDVVNVETTEHGFRMWFWSMHPSSHYKMDIFRFRE